MACTTTKAEGDANGQALHFARQHGAAGQLAKKRVKALVQDHVARKGVIIERGLAEQLIDLAQTLAGLAQHHRRCTTFRRDARQQPLHGAPQFDRIGHIPLGKGAHRVPPVGQRLQQPFLLQPHERGTDRRARDPQLFNQGQLGNPRTAWQFAGEDHLAQPQLGLDRLRAAFFGQVNHGSTGIHEYAVYT